MPVFVYAFPSQKNAISSKALKGPRRGERLIVLLPRLGGKDHLVQAFVGQVA